MINHHPLHELVAATHTPFHADGSLAPEAVPMQARFLAANGIRSVFITGSTGECHSITCQEKLSIYEAWATAGKDNGLAVIAHVGGNCIKEAKTLAGRTAELGFAAFSALAPSYFKPASASALVECCAAIAEQAPELPFYYYDIPLLTGVNFPMEDFLKDAPSAIPNLAGIKFTNPDLVSYRRALNVAGNRYDLPWGCDEALLAALAIGAKGAVGSTYNWAPHLYRNIISAFTRGDHEEARSLQSVAVAMIDAIAATGFLGTAKALMTHLGVPVGPARLPLGNPSAKQVTELIAKLDDLGFDDWGSRPPLADMTQLATA